LAWISADTQKTVDAVKAEIIALKKEKRDLQEEIKLYKNDLAKLASINLSLKMRLETLERQIKD
jgi:predicted  nucleic acid-binding Zn-ribbon protein